MADLQQEILQHLQDGTIKELKPGDSFNFACTDQCMGNCCQNIDIFLDPWDVETISRHLDISGQEFVKNYCILDFDERQAWPALRLKHVSQGPCAFMQRGGKCSIYPARSRNCRTAPIARAVRFENCGGKTCKKEKIFILHPADSCQGYNHGKQWTVQEWLKDCNAYKYYELSDLHLELIYYASNTLNSRHWLSGPVMQMMIPFLFAPDILRHKLNIRTTEIDHEEFYRRRMKALRVILTEMAGKLGHGPKAGKSESDTGNSLMSIAKDVLLANSSD